MKLKRLNAHSHQGPFLQINEDAYNFDNEVGIYMLLDGFGGSGIGDVAVSKLKTSIAKAYTSIADDLDSTLPFFYSPKNLLEVNALINSLLACHKELYEENIKKEVPYRAGASGIFIAKSDNLLGLVSIGNCRAYLLRNSSISKIFEEDSFNFISDENNQLSTRTIPTAAIGLYNDLYYQVKEVRIKPSDKILCFTDGIYGNLSSEEIKNIILNENIKMNERVKKLVDLSNERGNFDNQSALILEF
ncbi:MAG: protein phosphatase 2C domain-containing protein [Bacteriovoracaceae bacterium]|jgi:serine/threonine protein phosphatase PrpC|nr:protein phosphatase 2C domain-containing protein [Bacteriovoracaceae bacterium]